MRIDPILDQALGTSQKLKEDGIIQISLKPNGISFLPKRVLLRQVGTPNLKGLTLLRMNGKIHVTLVPQCIATLNNK